jgi:hypothetical protein
MEQSFGIRFKGNTYSERTNYFNFQVMRCQVDLGEPNMSSGAEHTQWVRVVCTALLATLVETTEHEPENDSAI